MPLNKQICYDEYIFANLEKLSIETAGAVLVLGV